MDTKQSDIRKYDNLTSTSTTVSSAFLICPYLLTNIVVFVSASG